MKCESYETPNYPLVIPDCELFKIMFIWYFSSFDSGLTILFASYKFIKDTTFRVMGKFF